MIGIPHALVLTLLMAPAAPRSTPEAGSEAVPSTLGPVGLAGILVGAAGVGLASAGVVRMTKGDMREVSESNRELILIRDPRPHGPVFLGTGVAVLAAGLTALVVDLTMLRRHRARRAALLPFLAPTAAGLVVRASFEIRP